MVDIETEWNLKGDEGQKETVELLRRYRNRVEFKALGIC